MEIPTRSVTVVKMIEEVLLGRRRHRSALGTQILLSCLEQRVVVPPQFDLPHVGMNAQKMIDKSLIKQVNLAQSGFFESVVYGRYTQWLGDFELPDSCEVKSYWHEGREA
jgi:hypothetical protein